MSRPEGGAIKKQLSTRSHDAPRRELSTRSCQSARPERPAIEFEQAAQAKAKSFLLPERRRDEGVFAWLRNGLGIAENTKASEQDVIDAVVRGAASGGNINLLSSLYDEGRWDPRDPGGQRRDPAVRRDRGDGVQAADEGGYLLELIKSFLVHLSWYPSLAEELENPAMQELKFAPKSKNNWEMGIARNPLARELTQKTCLLSNLMLVNSPMAARVLEAAAEEMVVFHNSGQHKPKPVRRYKVRKFPFAHDTMYVKRYIKERYIDEHIIMYDKDNKMLSLRGAGSSTPTSVEAKVTLPKGCRADVLIPLNAEKFCFVYPCSKSILPLGGWLYLDKDGKPLVINQIDTAAGHQAFAFGTPLSLSSDATKHISCHPLPEGHPHLDWEVPEGKGCTLNGFAWVMPDVDDEKLSFELEEKIPLGGFFYEFSDPTLNKIFPIQEAGEVLRTATLSWEVNAHALNRKPGGDVLERHLAPRGEHRAAPVTIMRITAPDVLHPVMLHALAFTPREDVLKTTVAQAITHAAFNRALPFYIQQFAFDLLSAVFLFYIAWQVHWQIDKGEAYWSFELSNAWAVSEVTIVGIVLLKNVHDEVRKFSGFWKCRWMHEYMNMNTFKNLGTMAAVAALLALLVLPNPPEDQGYLRTILAAAGFLNWIKVVTYARGIQSLRLGQKFLPIWYTLQEGLSFLAVMAFFILAIWHAFYTLSPEEGISAISLFRQTYELGFLGDYDSKTLLGKSGHDGTSSWAWVQQITFAVAAMLVVVMLTNIYIGVMGNAYNHNHGKALELFVRARASICLDISLQYSNEWQARCCSRNDLELQDDEEGLRSMSTCSDATMDSEGEGGLFQGRGTSARFRQEYVWFCRADPDYCLDIKEDDTSTTSVHQVRELQKAVEKVQKQVQMLSEKQGIGTTSRPSSLVQGDSPRKSHSWHEVLPFAPRYDDMPAVPHAPGVLAWPITLEEEGLASH